MFMAASEKIRMELIQIEKKISAWVAVCLPSNSLVLQQSISSEENLVIQGSNQGRGESRKRGAPAFGRILCDIKSDEHLALTGTLFCHT